MRPTISTICFRAFATVSGRALRDFVSSHANAVSELLRTGMEEFGDNYEMHQDARLPGHGAEFLEVPPQKFQTEDGDELTAQAMLASATSFSFLEAEGASSAKEKPFVFTGAANMTPEIWHREQAKGVWAPWMYRPDVLKIL
ncbi:unnamed protein product, partial [Amoebophrya sp. A25]|eukprot:GSA25T00005118001.1